VGKGPHDTKIQNTPKTTQQETTPTQNTTPKEKARTTNGSEFSLYSFLILFFFPSLFSSSSSMFLLATLGSFPTAFYILSSSLNFKANQTSP
jgi:hypothetical protein